MEIPSTSSPDEPQEPAEVVQAVLGMGTPSGGGAWGEGGLAPEKKVSP